MRGKDFNFKGVLMFCFVLLTFLNVERESMVLVWWSRTVFNCRSEVTVALDLGHLFITRCFHSTFKKLSAGKLVKKIVGFRC